MAKKNPMAQKTDQELSTLLSDTRQSLRVARFAAAGARPKDSNEPCKLRRTVARILTEQHARARKTANASHVAA